MKFVVSAFTGNDRLERLVVYSGRIEIRQTTYETPHHTRCEEFVRSAIDGEAELLREYRSLPWNGLSDDSIDFLSCQSFDLPLADQRSVTHLSRVILFSEPMVLVIHVDT